jgi:hypothetical protein
MIIVRKSVALTWSELSIARIVTVAAQSPLDLLRRYLDPGNADVGLLYLPLAFSYYKAYIFPRLCRPILVTAPQPQLSLKLGFAGAHSAEGFWEDVKIIENVPLAKPVLL